MSTKISNKTALEKPTILISQLRSIIEEQINSNELYFGGEVLNAIKICQFEVVYAAAEEVLHEKFLSMLKESDCPFRQ